VAGILAAKNTRFMHLTLILGPMKSGKSLELISKFAPLKYTNQKFALYQSAKNVRDGQIATRNGIEIEAKKVESLAEALDQKFDILGVDEMHMFPESDVEVVQELLKQGTRLIVSALDTDYQGRLFLVVKRLLEIGPNEVWYRRAVCDLCRYPEAVYTQVLRNGDPITEGIPPSVPDDGTFGYRSVCRNCFVHKA